MKFIVHVKFRSSHPEVLLGKGVLEICNKFIREQPYRSAISIKLLYNFTEITLRHGCSPINLLHIFRLPFPKKNIWMAASENSESFAKIFLSLIIKSEKYYIIRNLPYSIIQNLFLLAVLKNYGAGKCSSQFFCIKVCLWLFLSVFV